MLGRFMASEKNLRVYKANAVVEACYDLSVSEHRLLLLCFAQIVKEPTDEHLYRVYASDIAALADTDPGDAYRDAAIAAERLYERSVEVFEGPNGQTPPVKRRFRWIQEAAYSEGDGYVDVRLSTSILPFVNNLLEQYSVYHLKDVAKMTSRYGIRVYELLVQWRRRGHREVDVEWLRRRLGVNDKYPNFKDFRRRVIEPAVKQVNEHSPLEVDWEERKTGRRISHITFHFSEKPEVKSEKAEAAAKRKAQKEKREAPLPGDQKSMFGIPPHVIREYAQPGEDWLDSALRALEARKSRER